jgi:hypothetical protein
MRSCNGRLFALLLCGAGFAGCHTGSPNTFAGASTITALALGSAAAERAAGGCIAMCTTGTACNPKTGLCEVMPCRNQCLASEHCEQTFTGDKCMPGAPTGVESVAKANGQQNIPVAIPTALQPAATGGDPSIVPAAEQHPPSTK